MKHENLVISHLIKRWSDTFAPPAPTFSVVRHTMSNRRAPQSHPQGATDHPVSADGTDWKYNTRLRVIVHDARSCTKCSDWLTHFTHSVVLEDPSLHEAEAIRDTHIQGTLTTDIKTLRQDIQALCTELNQACQDHDTAKHAIDQWRDDYHTLEGRAQQEIDGLHEQITELERRSTPRRQKAPRCDSTSPSHSRHTSCNPSSRPSRPDSPMEEIRGDDYQCPATAPVQLLARIATAPPSSAEPSPSGDESLLARIEAPAFQIAVGTSDPRSHPGPIIMDHQAPFDAMAVSLDGTYVPPPTPINEWVGFPSLLPILYLNDKHALVAVPGTTMLDAQGNIDMSVHERFVYAVGGFVNHEPAWTTTLLH
jgi:hypothetical protein